MFSDSSNSSDSSLTDEWSVSRISVQQILNRNLNDLEECDSPSEETSMENECRDKRDQRKQWINIYNTLAQSVNAASLVTSDRCDSDDSRTESSFRCLPGLELKARDIIESNCCDTNISPKNPTPDQMMIPVDLCNPISVKKQLLSSYTLASACSAQDVRSVAAEGHADNLSHSKICTAADTCGTDDRNSLLCKSISQEDTAVNIFSNNYFSDFNPTSTSFACDKVIGCKSVKEINFSSDNYCERLCDQNCCEVSSKVACKYCCSQNTRSNTSLNGVSVLTSEFNKLNDIEQKASDIEGNMRSDISSTDNIAESLLCSCLNRTEASNKSDQSLRPVEESFDAAVHTAYCACEDSKVKQLDSTVRDADSACSSDSLEEKRCKRDDVSEKLQSETIVRQDIELSDKFMNLNNFQADRCGSEETCVKQCEVNSDSELNKNNEMCREGAICNVNSFNELPVPKIGNSQLHIGSSSELELNHASIKDSNSRLGVNLHKLISDKLLDDVDESWIVDGRNSDDTTADNRCHSRHTDLILSNAESGPSTEENFANTYSSILQCNEQSKSHVVTEESFISDKNLKSAVRNFNAEITDADAQVGIVSSDTELHGARVEDVSLLLCKSTVTNDSLCDAVSPKFHEKAITNKSNVEVNSESYGETSCCQGFTKYYNDKLLKDSPVTAENSIITADVRGLSDSMKSSHIDQSEGTSVLENPAVKSYRYNISLNSSEELNGFVSTTSVHPDQRALDRHTEETGDEVLYPVCDTVGLVEQRDCVGCEVNIYQSLTSNPSLEMDFSSEGTDLQTACDIYFTARSIEETNFNKINDSSEVILPISQVTQQNLFRTSAPMQVQSEDSFVSLGNISRVSIKTESISEDTIATAQAINSAEQLSFSSNSEDVSYLNMLCNESSMRPMGQLLIGIGHTLVNEFSLRDYIRTVKNSTGEDCEIGSDYENKMRLYKASKRRAKPYRCKPDRRCGCGFRESLTNILECHRDSVYMNEQSEYFCCVCLSLYPGVSESFCSYASLKYHMVVQHQRSLYCTVDAESSCPFCLYEDRGSNISKHVEVCSKYFELNENLQPSTEDNDIPIFSDDCVQLNENIECFSVSSSLRQSLTISEPLFAISVNSLGKPCVKVETDEDSPACIQSSSSCAVAAGTRPVVLPDTLVASIEDESAGRHYSTEKCSVTISPTADASYSVSASSSATPIIDSDISIPSSDVPAAIVPVRTQNIIKQEDVKNVYEIVPDSFIVDGRWNSAQSPIVVRPIASNVTISDEHSTYRQHCLLCKKDYTGSRIDHLNGHGLYLWTMLRACKCYLCLHVCDNLTCFEEHMLSTHAAVFRDASELWSCILYKIPPSNLMTLNIPVFEQKGAYVPCAVCGVVLSSSCFLLRHGCLLHGWISSIVIPDMLEIDKRICPSELKPFKCKFCEMRFSECSNCINHMQLVHLRACSVIVKKLRSITCGTSVEKNLLKCTKPMSSSRTCDNKSRINTVNNRASRGYHSVPKSMVSDMNLAKYGTSRELINLLPYTEARQLFRSARVKTENISRTLKKLKTETDVSVSSIKASIDRDDNTTAGVDTEFGDKSACESKADIHRRLKSLKVETGVSVNTVKASTSREDNITEDVGVGFDTCSNRVGNSDINRNLKKVQIETDLPVCSMKENLPRSDIISNDVGIVSTKFSGNTITSAAEEGLGVGSTSKCSFSSTFNNRSCGVKASATTDLVAKGCTVPTKEEMGCVTPAQYSKTKCSMCSQLTAGSTAYIKHIEKSHLKPCHVLVDKFSTPVKPIPSAKCANGRQRRRKVETKAQNKGHLIRLKQISRTLGYCRSRRRKRKRI